MKYTFKTKPFQFQKDALQRVASLTAEYGGAALLMEQGLGKTKVAVDLMGARYAQGLRRVLVVCPKTIIGTWADEIEKHMPEDVPVRVLKLEGSSVQNDATIELRGVPKNRDRLVIALVAYDMGTRMEARGTWKSWQPQLLVLDESQKVKSHRAARSRAWWNMAKRVPRRLLLTGTPIGNSPLDVFSQYRIMDQSVFGTRWAEFRNDYARMGGFKGYQIMGYTNLDDLMRKVDSRAFVLTKDEQDEIDFPEKTYVDIRVDLPPKHRKLYDDMERDLVAYLEDTDEYVTASIVLAKLTRCAQITSGFAVTEEGEIRHLHTAKEDATMELVEGLAEAGKPVVVVARFRRDISRLEARCRKAKLRVAVIQGGMKKGEPDRIRKRFQKDKYDVLIFQAQTGSLGLTLTKASHMIFHSCTYSFLDYAQAQDRIHRIGQYYPCTYYLIKVRNTVDSAIFYALTTKKKISDILMTKKGRALAEAEV